MLTLARLKEVLDYNSDTGIFFWKIRNSRRILIRQPAGYLNKNGYLVIRIDGINRCAHRLAWFYVYGDWPSNCIDHINGVKNDNRLSNLRNVTAGLNNQNVRSANKRNKLGILGVSQVGKKFMAQITLNNKNMYLGVYETPEEAHNVYLDTKRKLHEASTL